MAWSDLSRFQRMGAGILVCLVFVFLTGIWQLRPAQAVVRTWDGGGVDNNWSTPANWSGDTLPGASDVATFDGTSTKDATIDAGFAGSVQGIDINSGYTGTITQARSITVGSGNYDQAAGTFTGDANTMTVTGTFTLSGGTFNAPTGTLSLASNFTHTAGGTFNHSSGTVVFASSGARTLNVATTETFNNVEINATSATNSISISTGDTAVVTGTLTLTNGELLGSGTMEAQSSISHNAGFDGGSGFVTITSGLAFTPTSGGIMPGLRLNHASASFTGLGAATSTSFEGPVTVTLGTWSAGAGTMDYQRNLTVEPTATYNHNNGLTTFTGSTSATVNVDSSTTASMTLYDVTFNKSSPTSNLTVQSGDTLIVANTATFTNGELGGGTVRADGTVSIPSTFDGGAGVLSLNADIDLAPATGAILPGISLTHASSSLTGPGAATTITIEGAITTGPGTFTAGAGTVNIQRNFTVNTSGTFVHSSGTVVFNGSTATLIDVDVSETFNNVTVSKTNQVVTISNASDTVVVNGLLTLTDGTLGTTDAVFEQNGTLSIASTFDGGTALLEVNTLQTLTMTTGTQYPGMHLTVSGSSITGPAGASDTAAVEGDLILTSGTTFSAGAGTMTLGDDITVPSGATFNHNSGTIVLNDATNTVHVLAGDITFNNLTYENENSGPGLTLPSGDTTTILGQMKIYTGSSNPPLTIPLVSSTPGVQAELDFQGSSYLVYDLDVQDINNTGGTTLRCVVRCTDDGNNTDWYFGQPGVLVGAVSGNTTEAGGTATFTVVLRNEPSADVTVSVTSTDTTEGTVSAASLTFTSANWDTPQTVTITGVNDLLDDGGINYGVTLGAASSVDTLYNGLAVPDIELINEDNDADDNTLSFEDSTDFSYEDLATRYDIEWFEHDYYGHGILYDDPGLAGVEVDLTGTKVKAGCDIVIGGTSYKIARVWDQTLSIGEITITDDPSTSPEDLDLVLVSGSVDAITCSTVSPDGHHLATDDFVNSGSIDLAGNETGGYSMVYDAANNAMWTDGDAVFRLNLDDNTFDTFTRQSGFEPGIAIDTTRGNVWYPNNASDSISKINTTTGVATNYATCTDPESAIYDPTQDYIWVLCATAGSPDILRALSPVDGTVVTSVSLETDNSAGSFSTAGLVHDPVHNRIWAGIDNGLNYVVVEANTFAYAFGTLAASTLPAYVTDSSFGNIRTPLYVAATDTIWIQNAQCDVGDDDYITIFDADTGEVQGYVNVPSCPVDGAIDPTSGSAFYSSDHEGTFTEVRLSDNTVIERHVGMDPGYPLEIDAEGDLWYALCCSPGFFEYTRDGVPTDAYFTSVTTDTAQIDVADWDTIDSVAVNETLDSQSIYYTVSFDDRDSFKVWGSWRTVASSLASDHGGVDGNWYYRNDASTWTAAPSNTAEEAISLAIENGPTNNTMDGATIESLTDADWALAGGFDSSSTTTLDISTTFFTDDAHDSPSVQSIAFSVTEGGGGGGGGGSTSDNDDPTCSDTIDPTIQSLAVSSITDTSAMVSWTTDENADAMIAYGLTTALSSGTAVDTSLVTSHSFTLTGLTPDTDYFFQVASEDLCGNEAQSTVQTFSTTPPDAIPNDPAPPETPVTPDPIDPGDMVRTPDDPTVYYADPDGTLHPFPDLQTYLTYADSCQAVTYVSEGTIHEAVIGPGMMPRPGYALIKFAEGPEVYAIEEHPTDENLVLLRWLASEAIAAEMYGPLWADYVIEIDPIEGAYEIGSPVTVAEPVDEALLRSRAALNGDVTYELYIVNPDGTRRFANSEYARIETDTDGTILYQFEDKGEDFDYNDVVLRVDARTCLSFAFSVRPLDAAWHHMIGVQIFYSGVLEDDVILSEDSHESVDSTLVVDITNVSAFTPYEVLTQEQAESQGFRAVLNAALQSIGNSFRRLIRR